MDGSAPSTESVKSGAVDEQARLAALYELEILDSPPEQDFDDIVVLAAAICDTPIAIINFVDADRQWGKALIGLESSEAPRAASFCATTIGKSSGVMVVPDTLNDPDWASNPQVVGDPGLRFYAGATVMTEDGHALGTICVADNERPRQLDERALTALEALARQVAGLLQLRKRSLQLSSAYERLRTVAVRDPMTGLVNRVLLEHSLWLALRQSRRSGRPLGLLFCDLDGFKAVNDRLGHNSGDQLLRVVAERLTSEARSADLIARFGGDEFVVMCPDLRNPEDLGMIAERLAAAVSAPVELAGETIEPRLSIGSALARDADRVDVLLARADEDMYRSKREHR
jgi:diguanylate cyclase (GGDEF)-like protein